MHVQKQKRKKTITTELLIVVFAFVTQRVHSLFFTGPKFQPSSQLLWLYRPICVGPGPGRKPRLLVFSRYGSTAALALLVSIELSLRHFFEFIFSVFVQLMQSDQ